MTAPRPKLTFEESLYQAHAALRAGLAATAERSLRALEAQFPGEENCLWLLGAALLDQDRIPESIAMLEDVLVRVPDFASARVDLARALRRGGLAARARDEVRRVLQKVPHHHHAWLAYGDVLVDLDQYADARVAFERARITDPRRAQIEEATAALVADDRKTSERIFRGILQEDAAHLAAVCGLAALSLAADKADDAERLLRHALRQSTHHPLAWRGLGQALVVLGRLDEAEAAASRLIKIEPQNPLGWTTLASVWTRLMRQEKALEAYEQAARLRPDESRLANVHRPCAKDPRPARSTARLPAGRRHGPGSGYRGSQYCQGLADPQESTHSAMPRSRPCSACFSRAMGANSRLTNEAQLHFALGKAFEQRGQYADAFTRYARGNTLRRQDAPFDIEDFERRSTRIRRIL